MHQSGRNDTTKDLPDDIRDYDTGEALDTLQLHLPAVRLDSNGRPKEKPAEAADVMYNPEDALTKPSAPAAVFGQMTGRELPRKEDASLQDGDVLELLPDDMATRASAPHISFGNAKAHATGPDAMESGAFDYDPDIAVVRPVSVSVDFSRGRWRDELDSEPEEGPEAGDYEQPELDRGRSGVPFDRQVGWSDLERAQEPDDTDYEPNIKLIKPRLDRGVIDLERNTSRESYDSTEDDRDYDPKTEDPVLGAVVFDGQLARDAGDGPEVDDDRDYNPKDDLLHPQAPEITFDKITGRPNEDAPVDERDYEEPEARKATMPMARSVDFSTAAERDEDVK